MWDICVKGLATAYGSDSLFILIDKFILAKF